MREAIIKFAEKKVIAAFEYLRDFGYQMIKSTQEDDGITINYHNLNTKKDIDFAISDSEDVSRFFVIIFVVKNPYMTVNDLVSFTIYLQKNNMPVLPSLEGDQIKEEVIEKYIDEYAVLFKKNGISLIESEKQFPGYYPEWT